MKTIIVSDIHGCGEELLQLLDKVNYDPIVDEVISCGDLVEKGPRSAEVVALFQSTKGMFSVKGNHDESIVRYWDHELKVKNGFQNKNPMTNHGNRSNVAESLSTEQINYLRNLPMHMERVIGGKKVLIVHGGLFPGCSPERMPAKLICRLRFLKRNHAKNRWDMVRYGKESPGDVFWAQLYNGKFGHVFYGHQPYSGKVKNWEHATGMDMGACYGFRLGACVIDSDGNRTYESVKTKKYSEPNRLNSK